MAFGGELMCACADHADLNHVMLHNNALNPIRFAAFQHKCGINIRGHVTADPDTCSRLVPPLGQEWALLSPARRESATIANPISQAPWLDGVTQFDDLMAGNGRLSSTLSIGLTR